MEVSGWVWGGGKGSKALIILIILVEINEGRWYNWNGSEKSKQIYIVKKEKR